MRRFARFGCWLAIVGCWCVALAAEVKDEPLPRNPFWPTGYNGKRYPISAEPRYKFDRARSAGISSVSTAKSGEIDADVSFVSGFGDMLTNDPIWADAVQTLHFGSTLTFSEKNRVQAAIEINNRVYAVGDLVSVNFKGHRLTWRVESLSSEGKITLKRLTYRKIGPNS